MVLTDVTAPQFTLSTNLLPIDKCVLMYVSVSNPVSFTLYVLYIFNVTWKFHVSLHIVEYTKRVPIIVAIRLSLYHHVIPYTESVNVPEFVQVRITPWPMAVQLQA